MLPDMLEGSGQKAVQAGQLGHRQDSFIQQGLTHPLLRLVKIRVADPDPNWIRIQLGQWIRIRISYSESGSRRAKMTYESRKKLRNFMF